MGLSSILKNAEGSLILYNVTFDLNDKRTVLTPCVPKSAGEGEDKVTERVCFSDSIENCICALAVGNRDLRVGQRILVRSVSVSVLNRNSIIDYDTLHNTGKVPDAADTHEYWVTAPVNVSVGVYEILSFQHEFSVNWKALRADIVRRIAKGYVDISVCNGNTAYDVYCSVCKYLEDNKRYDDSDDFYEDIVQLPWAQGHKISDLKLECIDKLA